ncbi:hypothetical protein BDR03DRAFT_282867 [Suillus americanus]|nr:hypothetical protein BDR03DRAFT_282867 [Suillus americanus]
MSGSQNHARTRWLIPTLVAVPQASSSVLSFSAMATRLCRLLDTRDNSDFAGAVDVLCTESGQIFGVAFGDATIPVGLKLRTCGPNIQAELNNVSRKKSRVRIKGVNFRPFYCKTSKPI